MQASIPRRSVDLSGYPDLVVIMLGMRVNRWRGLRTLLGVGPQLDAARDARPDGLLAEERMLYSLRHVGFRQYWRDLESLERFTRSEPHRTWWARFVRDAGGTGIWHETYRMGGGMEAIYLDMPAIGFARFAPERAPRGPFASARQRLAVPAPG